MPVAKTTNTEHIETLQAMAALKIKTASTEIDPCYHCRLCGANAYEQDGETRTKDPSRPGCDLGWLNLRLDADCSNVLDSAYRFDKSDPCSPFFKFDNFDMMCYACLVYFLPIYDIM